MAEHERMQADIEERLGSIGIAANLIRTEYQNDLQDYEITIDGGDLTAEQIAGVLEATRLGGVVTFRNDTNTLRMHEAQARLGRLIMKVRTAEMRLRMPELPRFDRDAISLADFAKTLEIYSGVEPGSTLSVQGDYNVSFCGSVDTLNFDQFRRLWDAVEAALGDIDDVNIWMTGQDTADP